MVDSRYQQPLTGAGNDGDSSEEDLIVQDDELLVNENDVPMQPEGRRWNGPPRMSRRAPRSGIRTGVTRVGDVLAGKYMVETVRGRSGSEMVVFARHLELDQRVRLRYLLPEASVSPEAVARFQRGARRAREMRSEHAERVIDSGRLDSGTPYRVTEMPSGPSLEEMIRVRGALALGEAVDILIAVCEPVAEAHASGFVHRNLRTSNIFVERRADGSQLVRVLDFGVADPLEPDLLSGDGRAASPSLEGTMAFASPEQIRNAAGVDARADIWALGTILYELLTGVRVFEAETPLTLLAMIAADQATPIHWLRPEIPEALEQVVFSCLEKDPDLRPRSVVDLAGALAPFGSGDAPNVAGRVARIAMRTTRPPPLPSGVPHSAQPYARTRAIVRTTPPPTSRPAAEKPAALPSWATMTGGALLGVCAALIAALVLRLQPPVVAQPAVAQPALVVAAPVTAAAPVTPVPATPAQATPAPAATAAPLAAPLQAPVAPAVVQRPQRRAETETASETRPAPARRDRVTAPAETVAAGRATPSPNALFGGID